MRPRAAFEASVRHLPHPVLPVFQPLSAAVAEYPLVLVGHGLKRAYLLADRLVWRLPAEACPSMTDPDLPGHDTCVRTEDGAIYRVLDPRRLLEHIEAPAFRLDERLSGSAPVESRGAAAAVARAAEPLPAIAPANPDEAVEPSVAADAGAALETLPGLDLGEDETDEPRPIDPDRVAPMPLRALVAEDSLSARLALIAMIETHGIEAHAVRTAAELFEALERGPWALVCVDTELPDARGAELLRDVGARLRSDGGNSELVALVRDGEEAAAIEAGVVRSLRKPWSRSALERLIHELGLDEAHS
jgi:CheY-like chemotaxis protein